MIRWRPNSRGIRDLMRTPAVQADLEARARRIVGRLGPGYGVRMWVGRNRARATVSTTEPRTMVRERRYHTLAAALTEARD